MIIKQAIFPKATITWTENEVIVTLEGMQYVYVPTDKSELSRIYWEMVEIEKEFAEWS